MTKRQLRAIKKHYAERYQRLPGADIALTRYLTEGRWVVEDMWFCEEGNECIYCWVGTGKLMWGRLRESHWGSYPRHWSES